MKITQANKNQFPAIFGFLHSVVGDFYLEQNIFNTFVSLDELINATEKENVDSSEKLKYTIKAVKEGKLTKENIDNHSMFDGALVSINNSNSKQKEKIYFKDFMEAVTAITKIVRFKDPKDVFVVESGQHARCHNSWANSQRTQIPFKEAGVLAPVKKYFTDGVFTALRDYIEFLEKNLKQKIELEESPFENLGFGQEPTKGVIVVLPQKLYNAYNKELIKFTVSIETEDEAKPTFVFYGLKEIGADWVNF